MTHQPFQDWLFEDALDSTQADALHSHLDTCVECRSLVGAFHQVERSLHAAPLVAPTPGFTLRWQSRLDAERNRLHRRQVRFAAVIGVSGALIFLALLAVLLWPLLDSLDALFWAGAYQTYLVFAFVRNASQTLGAFARGLVMVLPVAAWILALGLLAQASVLWVVSYRYMTNPRRTIT
jgi:small-conductance mechanosensitive channel